MDPQTADFYKKYYREVENNERKDDSEDGSMKKLVELIVTA